ncbi:hypothetical protein DVH24_041443 [Malus domestica]|uniref:J domain-containing protein n=1 Tax=Malus domestica TaxID=3750 RepID=A0A498IA26_MALDO|nr:hypothetical protein DVH24_041443 [Malus domestica]
MDCNKEEAIRAKVIAEKKMQSKDFVGARKIAIKAQQLYPDLENASQMLMVCDVHCSAEKLFGTEMDWYGILQIDQTADEITIKKQYRKFALQLHPDKNKFSGAEAAFKLIGEAQRVLLDRDKRSMHDLKRKTSVSKTGVPHRPPHRASWNSNPGVQNNSRGNFTGVNLQSQQQQQPFPPGYSDARSTFWTACPFCSVKYQYYREVLLRSLRCQGCGKPFIAYDTNVPGGAPPPPPPPPPTNLSQQAFPPKKVNVNMSEVRLQRNVGAENSKAKPFQKTDQRSSSSSGVRSEKVKRKRDRKRVVESSESSDSESNSDSEEDMVIDDASGSDSEEDMVIDDAVLQAGLKSGIYGNQQPRRSSRHKQHISYKENLSDGEDTPLSKREKRTVSSCATEEENEDASKVEESIMNNKSDRAADTKGDEKVKQKEECLTNRVGEKKSGAKERVKASTHSNGFSKSPDTRNEDSNVPKGSSPEGIAIPEAEFYNFDADKSLEKFEIGQIWALYSDEDGLPKYYGQIKNLDCHRSKLHIAWLASNLLPDRVIRWHDEGMPVCCGRFRVRRSTLQDYDSTLSFSHRVNAISIGKNDFEIYPQRGEVWALYKNWTADLSCSDLDTCEYDIVAVWKENDIQREVLILERVDGFNSVFKTQLKGGSAETMTIRGVELLRFSHMIPSFKLTDQKGGSLRGCWELDPAALPLRASSQDAGVGNGTVWEKILMYSSATEPAQF